MTEPRRRRAPALPAALLGLVACAPAAVLPPPVPFAAGQSMQAGASASAGALWPAREDHACAQALGCAGASAAFWVGGARGKAELGVVGFAGNTSLFGGGVYGRYWYLETPDWRLGGELQAGWLWASAGVPMARRLGPNLWGWAAPSAGLRYLSLLRLPVGLSWSPREQLLLGAELSAGWDPWRVYQRPDAVMLQCSIAASWRW